MVGPTKAGGDMPRTGTGLAKPLRDSLPAFVTEILEIAYNVPAFWRLFRAYRRCRPDFVYERYNLHLLAGILLARLTGTPLILEVNSPLYEERCHTGTLALKALARWVERIIWRSADHVLPVTEVLAGYVRAAGVGDAVITVTPNGVDPRRYSPSEDRQMVREELRLGNRTVLGFVGFMRPWHGLEYAVELLAREGEECDLHLLIIGDGPARPDLETRVRMLGVEHRVTILGAVPHDRIPRLISAFDIALQPKVVPYASPLKNFEYMALARPIVAPDQANIREVLVHGQTALLFRPDDFDAFCEAVTQLCRDEGLRDRLGASARAAIQQRGFLWERNAERVEQIAHALIQGRAASRRSM